jgi:peptidoglycan hydrolase-like protein with peptidoglycan-binding domain
MRIPFLLHILLISLLLLFVSASANAGFLDNVLNKAKQAAEEIVNAPINDAVEDTPAEKPQMPQQQPVTHQQPVYSYEPALVKQIQVQLNQLGYNAGTPDGLYGPGTGKAIEAFQKSQGLMVDGKPSESLLANLKIAQPADSSLNKGAADSDLPEPTLGASMLAAVHFQPYLLDDESTLKRVLLTVHPEMQAVVSNEFQWHKRRDELKNQLLVEAKAAQLSFELQPWRDSSTTKARPVELSKYDFERQAFQVRFAVGTTRQVITKMLLPGGGEPASKYPQVIGWFPVETNKAEQIDTYFGNKQRKVYLHYRLKVLGALINASQPTPVIEFENNKLDLYALETTPQGNQMHTEYKYLATVVIETTDTPAAAPAVQKTVVDPSAGPTDVIKNVEIDGVRLGMPIEAALTRLAEHGFKMEPPSQNSKLTGITIEGRGTTADGLGWIEVLIRHMNGIVYQYDKTVGYRYNRLPENTSFADLRQKYQDEFTGILAGSRYSYTEPNGRMNFDDSSPPPYNRKITSPHASIILSEANNNTGRFNAGIHIEWKQPVGADW